MAVIIALLLFCIFKNDEISSGLSSYTVKFVTHIYHVTLFQPITLRVVFINIHET